MDKFGAILLLAILQLCLFSTIVDSSCCNGRNSEIDSDCNRNCKSECDCTSENCDSCSGSERCCQTCCNTQCNCQSVSCNTCSGSTNECCSSCCSNKCSFRSSGCSSRICRQCNCDNCNSSRQSTNSACCNSCCNSETKVIEKIQSQPTNVSQITTLPNITIIINHAPIYVNNTPIVNTQQTCGNASVLTNGTHIVYVYPQNSTCHNRTCCSRVVRPRCNPPIPPMPPSCPPPMYISDCSPRCMYPPVPPPPPPPMPMPMPMPMPVAPQPCQYFMQWPFVHCPQTNCYGYSCAPPPMPMPMPMPVPMVQPPSMYSGCIPFETWPYFRCIPGVTGDSTVSYGAPSSQMILPGVGGSIPLPTGYEPAMTGN